MDSYDGAKTCELIGLFLLSQLQDLNLNLDIYKDFELAKCNFSSKEAETMQKAIRIMLKRINLDEKKVTIILEVTLGLHKHNFKLDS